LGADHSAPIIPSTAEPDPIGFLSRVKGVGRKDMAPVAGRNAERLLGLTTAKA
jgi:hypothetical protein